MQQTQIIFTIGSTTNATISLDTSTVENTAIVVLDPLLIDTHTSIMS